MNKKISRSVRSDTNTYIIPLIATTATLIVIEFIRVQQGISELQQWLWYTFSILIILAISVTIGYIHKTIMSMKDKQSKKKGHQNNVGHGNWTEDEIPR